MIIIENLSYKTFMICPTNLIAELENLITAAVIKCSNHNRINVYMIVAAIKICLRSLPRFVEQIIQVYIYIFKFLSNFTNVIIILEFRYCANEI